MSRVPYLNSLFCVAAALRGTTTRDLYSRFGLELEDWGGGAGILGGGTGSPGPPCHFFFILIYIFLKGSLIKFIRILQSFHFHEQRLEMFCKSWFCFSKCIYFLCKIKTAAQRPEPSICCLFLFILIPNSACILCGPTAATGGRLLWVFCSFLCWRNGELCVNREPPPLTPGRAQHSSVTSASSCPLTADQVFLQSEMCLFSSPTSLKSSAGHNRHAVRWVPDCWTGPKSNSEETTR